MLNDFRFAIRQLLKSPVFALVAVATLALGIGANVTVLSWIDEVLLHPIPGAWDSNRLVVITSRHASGSSGDTLSFPDIRDLGVDTNIFDGVIGSQFGSLALGVDGNFDWLWGQIATANYFDVLGVPMELGRGFLPNEEVGGGGAPAAVISDGLWRRRFGADPGIIGRVIELNRNPVTVVGVAPAFFRGTMGGLRFDVWVPLGMTRILNFGATDPLDRADRWLHTVARLKPRVGMEKAQAAANTIMRRLEGEYPKSNHYMGVSILRLWDSPWGAQAILLPLLRVLMGVSILVFLLVTANLTNLLLAKSAARRREVAVRLAVGASRARLFRQRMTESLVLASLGGAGAIVFAAWSLGLLARLLPVTYLPIGFDLHLNPSILWPIAGFSLLAALIFGVVPSLHGGPMDLNSSLKEGARTDGSRAGGSRLRQGLVVAEVALALMLLVAAGLCFKSFQVARRADTGFSTDGVWLGGYRLKAHGYDDVTGGRFFRDLRQKLAVTPGVETAAFADWLPMGFEGGSSTDVKVEGYVATPGESLAVMNSTVSPDYFRALRIPLLSGREFAELDDEKAPRVVIVNEAFVDRFLKGTEPLGHKVHSWRGDAVIIGVVPTGKYRSLGERPQQYIYNAAWQNPGAHFTAVLRMKGTAATGGPVLARETAALDPTVNIWVGISFAQFTEAAFAVQGVAARLLLVLGVVALLLSALGIYGVIGFSVSQRTREIGVRMALGAQRRDIQQLILGQGLLFVGIGCGLGLLATALAGRILASLLIGVAWFDPVIVGSVTAGLSTVAMFACWVPARRAAAVDPMVALRTE